MLRGRVFVGDSALSSGTVVLHRVSTENQGEVDSTRVAADGSFSFRLPSVPDAGRSEVYFASVRHAGVLYFGGPVNLPVQLDSLYEIHTYDTLVAPPDGAALPVSVRNLFLEQAEGAWRVTDLFQVVNDEDRTLVAPEGGSVWTYPLPESARNATVGPSELAAGAAVVEHGRLVVRTPLPPGERLFVVRYDTPDPFLDIPLPGTTGTLEILVREPAPMLEAPTLTVMDRVELEPGTTYRRYGGIGLSDERVQLVEGDERRAPPAPLVAVVLALALGIVALWAVQKGGGARSRVPVGGPEVRRTLIVEIARLDEAFDAVPNPTPEERGAYEARRAELLRRIRSAS